MIRSHQKKKTEKISLKDFMLLIGSKLIDVYFEIREPFCLISSYYHYLKKPIDNIEEKTKLKKKYFNLFAKLKAKRYLSAKSSSEKCRFYLTKKSKKYIATKYPHLYFNKQNWDKKLRLVIFDVQEINRFKIIFLKKKKMRVIVILRRKIIFNRPNK